MTAPHAVVRRVPGGLSDEEVLPFEGLSAMYPPPESDSLTIPLAPWLQAILPAIRRIQGLEHDWDSYGSPPPPKQLVDEIILLLHRTEMDFPPPAAVPVSGGGVQLEWYLGRRELEVEFAQGRQAEFLATDVELGQSSEGTFYRSDFRVMRTLIRWLTEA